jgi:ligand-binding sensor domain-containing protein
MRGALTNAAIGTTALLLCLPLAGSAYANTKFHFRDVVYLPIETANDIRVNKLSTVDGLSQARVAQIIQDDKGFMWFGTQYGLNRYDGYGFKLFVHEPGNSRSASGSFVYSLFKDRDGFIWVGWSRGLDRLDPRTETFTHYFSGDDGKQDAITVIHISQDRRGMLWLASGSGLWEFDPATRKSSFTTQMPRIHCRPMTLIGPVRIPMVDYGSERAED